MNDILNFILAFLILIISGTITLFLFYEANIERFNKNDSNNI